MKGGVVFDFDGLLLNTELHELIGWQQVFERQGVWLDPKEWAKCVGGGDPPWRVEDHLAELCPDIDIYQARRDALAIRDAGLIELTLQPGAHELLDLLDAEGIPFGIASNARSLWVEGFLANLEMRHRFACICTQDMVGVPKPNPAVYLLACDRLGIDPARSLGLEDSSNGVAAAKAAGMSVFAIPNEVTRSYDFSAADELFESLVDITLDDIRRFVS